MTFLPHIRNRAVLLVGVALALDLAAGRALAGPPDQAQSMVDHVIIGSFDTHGATSGFGPCSNGTPGFDVYVRDAQGQPVVGSVTVQFAGSGTGIRPFLAQNPGVTVDCTQRTLTTTTDANGHAVMVPRFGHFSLSPQIPVFANGQFLRFVEARSPDYDGDGQISLADFNQFAADFPNPVPQAESDFDDCPTSRLGDFSFFVEQFLWDQGRPIEQRCN